MKRVLKYAIDVNDDRQMLSMPIESRLVLVGEQGNGKIVLWFEIDMANQNTQCDRFFRVFGTGHDIPNQLTHVGSLQMPPFVWHVYEDVGSAFYHV